MFRKVHFLPLSSWLLCTIFPLNLCSLEVCTVISLYAKVHLELARGTEDI